MPLLRQEVRRQSSRINRMESDGKLAASIGPPVPCHAFRRHFLDRRLSSGQIEAPTRLGNLLGNRDFRIGVIPIKIGVSRANSMASGPTNSRCSETIGNDRGGTAFGSKHRKNRCIGLELAYKRWSLTIAEDRRQPDIFGVTLGVTLGVLLELPP